MALRNVSQKAGFDTVKIGDFSFQKFLPKVSFAKKNEQNLSPIVSKQYAWPVIGFDRAGAVLSGLEAVFADIRHHAHITSLGLDGIMDRVDVNRHWGLNE